MKQLVEATNQMECAGVTVLREDASGHGKPAENVQATMIIDAVEHIATVALPVVLTVSYVLLSLCS